MTKDEEIAALKEQVAQLKEQLAQAQGNPAAGWLISTPVENFSGQTMNIQFRRGQAFLPASPENERLAKLMRSEFGYKVAWVEDFRELPPDGPVRRSMIDMLMIPQQAGGA